MKSQQNNICICGHIDVSHKNYKTMSGSYRDYCITCLSVLDGHSLVHLHSYKRDNLRFLEICYEEKAIEA